MQSLSGRVRSILPMAGMALFLLLLASGVARAQNDGMNGINLDSIFIKRGNLGTAVNGPGIEILPILSPDGTTLYFDRKYDPKNVGGVEDDDDIYYSTLGADGRWSVAKNIGAPLNTRGSDVLFWISPDGATALVHNGAVAKGKKVGLAISQKKNGKWTKPQQLRIQGLNRMEDLGEGYSAHISPDGRRLVVAAAMDPGNPDNQDLFSAPALSSDYLNWGPLVSMGDSVNSPRYEWAPFVAADNRTVYYASGGLYGFGASDLYMIRRLDDSWQRWSEPVNLGTAVNTFDYDASITIAPDGATAYLAAVGRPGEENFGKSDIYRVALPDTLQPIGMAELTGTLRAGVLGVQGLVRVERVANGEEIASTLSELTGAFRFRVPTGEQYRLTGWAEGHEEVSATVDARANGVFTVNLSMQKEGERKEIVGEGGGAMPVRDASRPEDTTGGKIARVVALDIAGFEVGSAEIPADAVAKLQGFLTDLRTLHAGLVVAIEVAGHTDSKGENGENQGLSMQRAEKVKEWLVANGVDASMILTYGRGEIYPAVPNASDDGRARNRRVEIRILKGDAGG